MSYEYYLQAHLNQDFQEISTERILAIFKEHITAQDEGYIDLKFDDINRCTIYLDMQNATISSFMVSRPCGSKQLGVYLYEVMLLGNFVFYEPDGKHPIIVNPATAAHLPPDMIETLGEPAVAENLEGFLELYFNNR
jgi:hypothetical protein